MSDYSGVDSVCYSDSKQESYKKAGEFFGELPVEDWGGGTGWVKRYIKGKYRNIDGSPHPQVDEVVDLADYTSTGWNILIRQVLGCAGGVWKQILANALKSFDKKLCIIIGTPFVETTLTQGDFIKENYFNKQDLLANIPEGLKVTEETVDTDQYYQRDWIIYVEKIS